MKYDFTTVIPRRGKDALAIDAVLNGHTMAKPQEGFDLIPMWIADMNFPTVPTIPAAVIRRAEHPLYGYFEPSDEYFESIIRWQNKRNGVTGLTPEAIGYENGVLGCVSSALQAFSAPGEKILLHSPTYIGFTEALEYCGRIAELSPLVQDENGTWRMDYADMDRRLKKNHIHLAIFCTPHNPSGRVWERWEIEKAMEVYAANHCVVISDEIWSDLILPGHKHIPTQSISEDARKRTIAVYAPSKTFNLAGLVGSYHIIYDPYLRDRLVRQSKTSHYNAMNVLSMHALIGAYGPEGCEWLDELCEVLGANVDYACDFIRRELPGVTLQKPQGTYLLYLHCEEYCKKTGKTMDDLLQAAWAVGVGYQDGRPFHDPWGIRINLALPLERVKEAMDRLKKYVFI